MDLQLVRTKWCTFSLVMLLAGCGGGSSDEAGEIGSAMPGGETAVNGRVADGYIVGATVCVDLNENEACDADEPSAVTTAGGQYSLDRPEGSEDKPIVADIPDTAIDEDTGEPIGNRLILVAPGNRPEFVSPLTTLIHEELKQNPALDLDAAEATVKAAIGLESEDDVSLFVDYVARGESTAGPEQDRADEFRYLHQTARVIASMMADIQKDVDAAAVEQGIDVGIDDATRQAIREIVRSEVKKLLGQIAEQVAAQLQESGATTVATGSDFDPTQIVGDLRPSSDIGDLHEQITAIRDRAEIVEADMRTLLTEGMYWIDFHCPGVTYPTERIESAEGSYLYGCKAEYGEIGLNADGVELEETTREYDVKGGIWVDVVRDGTQHSTMLALVDRQWVAVDDDAPTTVVFTDDGGVVASSSGGTTTVHASTRELDATQVLHHVVERGANPALIELAEAAGVFPADSSEHHLTLKNEARPYLMFNWPDSGQGECADYNGNCNVIKAVDATGDSVMTALPTDEEIATGEVVIVALMDDYINRTPINVKLLSNGDAVWIIENGEDTTRPYPYPEQGDECLLTERVVTDNIVSPCLPPECDPIVDGCLVDFPDVPEGELPPLSEGEFPVDPEGPIEEPVECIEEYDSITQKPLNGCLPPIGLPVHFDEATGTVIAVDRPGEDSHWVRTEVDGVSMIKVSVPWILGYRLDDAAPDYVLLIDDGGMVRRGIHSTGTDIGGQVTYSQQAFDTLLPVIKSYIDGQSAQK